jgi:signal transduction histidine kinase
VIEVALLTIAATVAVSAVTIAAFRLLPTVQLQLAALAVFACAVPLASVTIGGLVMFHMHQDFTILSVLAGSAASALAVALLLGRRIGSRVRGLERTAAQLAAGDLTARAPVAGPRELATLSASFNQMAESIGDLFDARRQLVAWASHDLRTPLASIKAMLEAIEDGLATPDDYLPAISEQAGVLATLTDDLFELACIDAGTLTVELRETSLRDLVTPCVDAFRAEATARGVLLEVHLGDRLPPVTCAPEQVRRVLLNLLTNALRHTPSDGSVAVVARAVGREVQVLVEDSGSGLSHEAAQRMFERFWRGDPARTRANGNAGLGLAIARGLVEAHGGRVWAENRAEGGARVAFSLPVAGTFSHS